MEGPSDVKVWVCGGDGQWTGEQPNCEVLTCPSPPIPAYGGVNPVEADQYSYGDTIDYSCQDGYQLTGSAENTCGPDGSWANEAPACRISGTLCDPQLNDVMTSQHSCIKASQLLVQDTMTWDDANATCQDLGSTVPDGSCTGRISNDALVLLDYRHKCYRFSTVIVTWSTARDTCTTEGGSLVEVIDGSLQTFLTQQAMNIEENFGIEANWWIGGYDDGSATDRAWFWMDNTRATYMSWNSGQPTKTTKRCVEVNSDMNHNWNDRGCNSRRQAMCQIGIAACGDPGAPSHGTRSPGDRSTFLDGAVIQFSCDPGYELEGATEITCQPDGSWDGVKPLCAVISCGDQPPAVLKALITDISHIFRGTAVYTCNEGSGASGNPLSHCQADATWSQPDFQCIDCSIPEKTCPHCTVVLVSTHTYPVGTYLQWRCEENYVMEGPSDVKVWVCGGDGQWTGEQPNCEVLTCPSPPIPAYGGVNPVEADQYSYGDTIDYSCQDGYQLTGSAENTCGPDGSWANEAPTCRISETLCDPKLHYDVMTSRHSCIKASQILVKDTMTWYDAKVTCQDLGSTVPGELAMIKTEAMQEDVRDLINLPKTLGYSFDSYFWIGAKEDTRATYMSWNSGQPTKTTKRCVEVNSDMNHNWNDKGCNSRRQAMCQIGIAACGDRGAPSHGTRSPGDRSTFLDGAVIQFSCDPGYELEGATEITCQPDGSWDGVKPLCAVVIIAIVIICIVVWRRRQLRKSPDTSSLDTPTYDCIGNIYNICFTKDTRGTVGNNNDSYIGLDLGRMQSVETDESRYLALGEGITGRPITATGSSSPRGRPNTGISTTELVDVDNEGYASLRIGEVRSIQQLPYTTLSRWGNSDQRRGQNVSEGDVGGREGADFDQFRSTFEAQHRSSIDTDINLYETVITPRPSRDMGVLRKQGSLGESEYEELDNMNINPNNDADPLTSQGATPLPNQSPLQPALPLTQL
ncbi:sushi, von Willebrand factor type A, EGF and pentraxin domain-containing protein 1-like [Strongylocentrotus purpuratus]|uniref:Uncharacterized protein n=1 Tax=Strongylocentrotus purpuratus TaxID=7668 RepID=A0A7M7NCS5_STRPU|nr:sushi, von Willebrand factor type A, EGF and pentraxin domain-containing protein 1-like [Strongylocentrotus purpuratus]